jgi:hypothetical protein
MVYTPPLTEAHSNPNSSLYSKFLNGIRFFQPHHLPAATPGKTHCFRLDTLITTYKHVGFGIILALDLGFRLSFKFVTLFFLNCNNLN